MTATRLFLAAITGAAVAALPGAALAQACIGHPMEAGGTAVRATLGLPHPGGDGGFGQGVQTFGADIRSAALAPLTLGAAYDLYAWDIDGAGQVGHQVGAIVAWELVRPAAGAGLSLCAVTLPSYYTFSGEDAVGPLRSSVLRFPLGVGAAWTHVLAPRYTVTPFVVPQLVLGTESHGVDPNDFTDSFHSLGAILGLTLGFDWVFLSAGLSWHRVTVGDEDPVAEMGLRISVGANL